MKVTPDTPLKDRLEIWSMPIPESGCQIWIGACFTQGYGVLRYKGKNLKAHRVAYQEHIGAIPNGLFVCHKCDIKSCVNPNHLFLGTQKDNIRDRDIKKRGPNSRKTHCKKGHAFKDNNIVFNGLGVTDIKRRCRICNNNWQNQRNKTHGYLTR